MYVRSATSEWLWVSMARTHFNRNYPGQESRQKNGCFKSIEDLREAGAGEVVR